MLKVNSSPYLLLVDLHEDVDDALSAATLTADGVKFKLFKRVPGLWGRLTREASSKEELQARRNASIDRAHARLEEARLARLERKQKSERVAIDRQIEIERKKRLEIDRRKGEELDIERGGIQAWQQQLHQQQQKQQLQLQQGNESDYESEEEQPAGSKRQQSELPPMPDHEHYYGKGWRPSSRSLQPDTWADVQGVSSKAENGGRGGGAPLPSASPALPEAVFKPLPPPRMRLEPVRVEFTKLETPHLPARYESGLMDEADMAAYKWQLLRVRVRRGQALCQMGRLAQALQDYEHAMRLDPGNASLAADVEELRASQGPADVQALKQRGAARFQAGDHAGAVEAWGLLLGLPHDAVPASEQQAALSNRAAALLVLGRFAEGEADCCCALALALAALHSQASQQQQQPQEQQQQGRQHTEQAQQQEQPSPQQLQAQHRHCDHHHQQQQQSPLPSSQPHQLPLNACTFTLHPPALPLGDPAQLASAAHAAATATQGELARTAASMEEAEAALRAYVRTLAPALRHWHHASQQQDQQLQDGNEQPGHNGQQEHFEQQGCNGQQGHLKQHHQQQQQQQQQEGLQGTHHAGSAAVAVKGLVSPLARLLARRGALRGHMRLYSSAFEDCQLAAQLYAASMEPEKARQLEADACTLSRLMDEHKASSHHAQPSLDECPEV
ncbi:hypothetical protein DUNSADRAFT_5822 [Dunaliella salina]|uniref:Uncharacterized protein n=1 Tax=Dunaliella salina TaxID=3046 RepID=A0ABQ7GPK9_DUNSA|nr:hypothetical protein DUNSADRAFT_5822 [Dunaliella salina]KAF5836535.1 hypothetical protein DUNSADRAFT_5822 [Dunaliella salina]|eukprot:KAF5836534.1 hypothetical protein DUNSADRAFT_5822 [Dunaliella salina]